MAKTTFTDCYVSIGGVDLSNHVRQVSFGVSRSEVDQTTMGDAWENILGGPLGSSFSVTMAQDFAAGSVNATTWTDISANTESAVALRFDKSDGVSATNPTYTGTCVATAIQPIEGSYGDLAENQLTYSLSNGAGWVQTTA